MAKKGKDGGSEQNLHAGHRSRMRERFALSGFDGYQPHEMLEQLLFEGQPRVNTNPIAHRLINRFGSLEGVLNASLEELMEVEGIGRKSALLIRSVLPGVTEEILEQYRGCWVTPTGASFLWDWFLRRQPQTATGWIDCDTEGKLLDYTVLTDLLSTRESMLAFGASSEERHGILMVNDGAGWNAETFAFLDGVLSIRGGMLHGACILRKRKIVRLWKDEIRDDPLSIGNLEPGWDPKTAPEIEMDDMDMDFTAGREPDPENGEPETADEPERTES